MQTYAIKGEEKILVTSQNKDTLIGYNFIQEEQTELEKLKNELEKVTNDLVNINGKIEGAKKLKDMGIFDDDDEIELSGYETKAQELIVARSGLKVRIKELGN